MAGEQSWGDRWPPLSGQLSLSPDVQLFLTRLSNLISLLKSATKTLSTKLHNKKMQLQFKWHEDDTRPREVCSRKIGWISKDSPTPCYRFGNICCKFFCGVSAKFHSPQSTTCKVQSLCPCWQNMPFFASNNSKIILKVNNLVLSCFRRGRLEQMLQAKDRVEKQSELLSVECICGLCAESKSAASSAASPCWPAACFH